MSNFFTGMLSFVTQSDFIPSVVIKYLRYWTKYLDDGDGEIFADIV